MHKSEFITGVTKLPEKRESGAGQDQAIKVIHNLNVREKPSKPAV